MVDISLQAALFDYAEEFNVKHPTYGAVGDGTTNDSDAFIACAAALEAADGGYFKVPPGSYAIGKQVLTGAFGQGRAYQEFNIIEIHNCTKPVVIDLRGCYFKTPNGMKYGSFNPVTGAVHNPTLPFTNPDYIGNIGSMIDVRSNDMVVILGPFEMDGNIANAVIGGGYGDTGWQTVHGGCVAFNNKHFAIRGGCNTHHFGLDGLSIGGHSAVSTDIYPHILEAPRSNYNGRLGMSWVGGNHLHVTDFDFSHNGRNGVVSSNPNSGVDIENEGFPLFGGTFTRGKIYNNVANGYVTDAINFDGPKDITWNDTDFIGNQGNYAFWGRAMHMRVNGGKVLGNFIAVHDAVDPADRAEFRGVVFSLDPDDFPDDTDFVTGTIDCSQGGGALYEGCVFKGANSFLPRFPTGSRPATISNCKMSVDVADVTSLPGIWVGHNTVDYPVSGSIITWVGTRNYGRLEINGVDADLVLKALVDDTSSIVSEAGVFRNFSYTMVANRTLGTPSNLITGKTYRFEIRQAASGGPYNMTWPSVFDWGVAGTPTISTGAGLMDVITAFYDGTKLRSRIEKGFA